MLRLSRRLAGVSARGSGGQPQQPWLAQDGGATPAARGAITANIVGGMGNQLFLVAALLATARRNGLAPYLERAPLSDSCEAPRPTYWSSLLADLDVPAAPPADVAARLQPAAPVPEPRPATGPIDIPAAGGAGLLEHHSLVGFFQSEAFFGDMADELVQLFTPTRCIAVANERVRMLAGGGPGSSGSNSEEGGKDDDSNSSSTRFPPQPPNRSLVALHVRRGDYLRMTDVFEVLDHRYYMDALEGLYGRSLAFYPGDGPSSSSSSSVAAAFGDRRPAAPVRVLVFCEDAAYGRTLCGVLESRYPAVSAVLVGSRADDPSLAAIGTPAVKADGVPLDVQELLMMALCNDVVMANSSYSWWGAYLNQVPMRRVVAPARWFVQEPFPSFTQIYCDGWMVR